MGERNFSTYGLMFLLGVKFAGLIVIAFESKLMLIIALIFMLFYGVALLGVFLNKLFGPIMALILGALDLMGAFLSGSFPILTMIIDVFIIVLSVLEIKDLTS